MTFHVIVPSCGRLSPDMVAETACEFAAFVPLGGTPMYKHILAQYQALAIQARFTFVVAPDAPPLQSDDFAGLEVETVVLPNSRSIGETILAGLHRTRAGETVIVNMADTLAVLQAPVVGDTVYTQLRSDLYRWTSVQALADGGIAFPHDRDNPDAVDAPQAVCVGVFTFGNAALLARLLASALERPAPRPEPFFSAVERYAATVPLAITPTSDWHDCGHVDTYYETRLRHQNLRHFNELSYDPVRGQVTKRSSKEEQFRHQVRWFKQVPDSLSAFLPRVFQSSDGESPFITMELLSIPTLSEVFVSRRMSPGAWNGVARTIKYIQAEMQKLSFSSPLACELARSMYMDKTVTRIGEYTRQDPLAATYHVVQDGQRIDLAFVSAHIGRFVEETGLLSLAELSPIHGDFCFSNLLFDPKARIVKMIDPRGEFGVPGIYGDHRYDLAKLAHSYAGGYDLIVSDQFKASVLPGGEIDFNSGMDNYHAQVKDIFESILKPSPSLQVQVQAIEALLFLSMLPLHVDKPRRQLAMLATGLRLFAKTLTAGAPA